MNNTTTYILCHNELYKVDEVIPSPLLVFFTSKQDELNYQMKSKNNDAILFE